MTKAPNPFPWFDSSPEVICLVVMMYVRYPLSLPPTGLALGLMLLRGYRIWPAILAGAIAANVQTSGWTALAIGAGNTLALAGAWLVNALAGGVLASRNPVGVAKFAAVVCAVATPISATIGVLSLTLSGHAAPVLSSLDGPCAARGKLS